MIELKDNYQDDVLDSEKNQLRKYNMIQNDDGTVSFVDATVYSQNGDTFGAKDVNDIVARIGEVSKAENIAYDGDKSVQDAIDELAVGTVLPRYKKINLSSSGWYRVAKMECGTTGDVNGVYSNSCDMEIKRNYSTIPTEYKKIQMVSTFKNTEFCNEISKTTDSSSMLITSIRHTIDDTNKVGYIEIYYNSTKINSAFVSLSNYMNSSEAKWKLIDPVATSETVSGVTVLGSHNFSTNYDVQTQLDTKINKNLFSSWPSLPNGSPSQLWLGNTYEIGFAANRIFLMTLFSEYNLSCVYTVETGGYGSKCKVAQIKGDTSHFTVTPLTGTTLNIECIDANCYPNYMCIGGA